MPSPGAVPEDRTLPDWRGKDLAYLGQLARSYLLFECENGLLVVDHHAAVIGLLGDPFGALAFLGVFLMLGGLIMLISLATLVIAVVLIYFWNPKASDDQETNDSVNFVKSARGSGIAITRDQIDNKSNYNGIAQVAQILRLLGEPELLVAHGHERHHHVAHEVDHVELFELLAIDLGAFLVGRRATLTRPLVAGFDLVGHRGYLPSSSTIALARATAAACTSWMDFPWASARP